MKLSNHIEAILFLKGEPVGLAFLAKILNKEEKEIEEAIKEVEKDLLGRGIRLLKKDNKIMLGTAPESSKYCEALIKEELNKNIGKAGLETLAIILYKGQALRSDIDYIRGVNSTFTLRNLLIRGLIERKINPQDKRRYVYLPSMRILQHLGLTKKEDLPEFEIFIEQIKNAVESNEKLNKDS